MELEKSVELVGLIIRLAYQSNFGLKEPKSKQRALWWSRVLQEQCAKVRRAFHRAYFAKNEQDWKAHADLQRSYE